MSLIAPPPDRTATTARDANAPVAVIGAGIAGLACARELERAGVTVDVFEKSRGVGGRASTRRLESTRFDLGAPYLIAVQREFADWLVDLEGAGGVRRWPARVSVVADGGVGEGGSPTGLVVGVPGMSEVARRLGRGCRVHLGVRVREVVRSGCRWVLRSEGGDEIGSFGEVVVAVPAPQAVPLLASAPTLAKRAAEVRMSSTWVVCLGFGRPVRTPFEVGYISHPVLALAVHDGAKPQRHCEGCWVLHASHHWTRDNLEAEPAWIARRLESAFKEVMGAELPRPDLWVAHRWRFACALDPLDGGYLRDPELRLAACGDWCVGSRLEHAWSSGSRLAAAILEDLAPGRSRPD